MNTVKSPVGEYYLVIHGECPLLIPFLAFRRNRYMGRMNRKIVRCPYCASRLTDVDVSTKVEVFRYPEKSKMRCQVYRKCGACHREIGFNLV